MYEVLVLLEFQLTSLLWSHGMWEAPILPEHVEPSSSPSEAQGDVLEFWVAHVSWGSIECKNLWQFWVHKGIVAWPWDIWSCFANKKWFYTMIWRNPGDLVCRRALAEIWGNMITFFILFPKAFRIRICLRKSVVRKVFKTIPKACVAIFIAIRIIISFPAWCCRG